jgi:iron complex outermembrane recepter protein
MKSKLLFCLWFVAIKAFAQSQSIKITLIDKKNEPVIGSAVILKERNDTLKTLMGITDTIGQVIFKDGKKTQYLLRATFIGFKPLNKGIVVTDKQTQFTFTMEEQAEILRGVEIVAKKPLMTQDDDKLVVDPEPLALASTSALEVLEKTPGLFIDQDGNIYLTSSTPAAVYINGREQRMSQADVAALLRILPPSSIEKIEIMRTPSAKYDAGTTGGVVNVILKKGVKIGLTGSVNGGFNQGVYGNQFAGINISNNDGDKTSFFNLNYNHQNGFNKVTGDRTQGSNRVGQNSYSSNPSDAISAGFGFGREFKKKWTFNYDGRTSYTNGKSAAWTESTVKNIPTEGILSNNTNQLNNKTHNFLLNQGLASKYKIDTSGSEWTSDVAYTFSNNDGNQIYATDFSLPKLPAINGNGDWDSRRHFLAAQTNLKLKLPHKITFETGLRSTFQDFESTTAYFRNGQKDNFRTNAYSFNDNVNALYVQGSKKMGEFILKIGARLEQTNMSGRQTIPSDTFFNIHRTDLFPYLFFSRKVAKIAGYELRAFLVARKTITRPSYDALNPFPKFLDQYLYETGNPSLKPQFTNNYEINISVDERPIMAFGKNYTQDIFTNVLYPDPQNPVVNVRTYDNLGKNTETYAQLVGAIPPGKKYFFVVVARYSQNDYQGLYNNQPLSFKRSSWTFFTYHSLKLNKTTNLSMNGFYRLKGQLQFYELDDFGQLNFNISKQFLDRKLTASLNFQDVFYTSPIYSVLNQGGIQSDNARLNDTRRVGLNMRYIFGLRKKQRGDNMFDAIPE